MTEKFGKQLSFHLIVHFILLLCKVVKALHTLLEKVRPPATAV